MSSIGVAEALVIAIVALIATAAMFFWRRSPSAPPQDQDRAWDRHARNRASVIPPASAPRKASNLEASAGSPRSRRAPNSAKGPPSAKGKGKGKRRQGASSKRGDGKVASSKRPAATQNMDARPGSPAGKKSAPPGEPDGAQKAPSVPPETKPSGTSKAPSIPPLPPAPQSVDALPSLLEGDDDMDLTVVTLGPLKSEGKLVSLIATDEIDDVKDDDDLDRRSAVPIVYDDDAAVDEPTAVEALILLSAAGQTDRGQRRRKNEDSYAILDAHGLFIVADGMGGHSGGEVASKIAVDTVTDAFVKGRFPGDAYPGVPRRGSELALAIQMANQTIYERARAEPHLAGMGTTVVSARFSPNKQRVYIGHVGDSRCYRLRDGALCQITTDHTMGASGLTGPLADRLERAVGISPLVKVDVILARPLPEDLYLLCSDGLTKMVPAASIQEALLSESNLDKAVAELITRANASGGKDNITVILVRVTHPTSLKSLVQR
jgi:PPM family protein phosphatase